MSRIALYREWRPRTFDQVVEQRHTVAALRQSVISGNISHAYLFSGTRGTGKTSLAQIFSRAINCLDPHDGNPCNTCEICRGILSGSLLDVVEVDAASNNSVDNIRRICDEVNFMPSQARYKIYIIDEVHMLSPGAFNALLKTLEEPPAHAVFILATTDPHRIPPTIISRCQRYDFHRIPVSGIVGRLRKISDADGIRISDDALEAAAVLADGALRDAISLLDQCRATFTGEIGRDDVLSLAGVVNDAFMYDMASAMYTRNAARAMSLTDAMILDGRDVVRFTSDLAAYFRDVMMCKVTADPATLVRASTEAIQEMKAIGAGYTLDTVLEIVRVLSALLTELRWAPDPRTMFEITLIRIMQTTKNEKPAPAPQLIQGQGLPAPVTQQNQGQDLAAPAQAPDTQLPLPQDLIAQAPAPQLNQGQDLPVPVTQQNQGQDLAAPAQAPVPQLIQGQGVAAPAPVKVEAQDDDAFEQDTPFVIPEEPYPDSEPAWPQAAPAPAVPMNQAPENLQQAWENMLNTLCNDGQMLLYLYLRPARVSFADGKITVLFHPDESLSQAEVTRKPNASIMRDALAKAAGRPVDLVIRTEAEVSETADRSTAWQDSDWVRKIRTSADEMGIPVTYNEG
ncbi:MAG TPA: DNA polymerase III subunit gamma/tau [Clostridia bacterium]